MDEFSEIVQLPPVLLARSDLAELEPVLLDEMTNPEASFDIEEGPRRIKGRSIAELLEKKLPDQTNAFHARVVSWSENSEIDASLSLTLFHNYAQLQLSASTEGRFLAKKHQVLQFFQRKRPWYSFLVRAITTFGGAVTVLGLMISSSAFANGRAFLGFTAGVLALMSLVVSVLALTNRLFPYVRIRLKTTANPSRREFVIAGLEVALLLATIASIVLQIGAE